MGFLSDKALGKLRSAGALPDFSGTRYALTEFLARGGMGAVYCAEDRILQRNVAIKILDTADPEGALAERLNREARVLAQLEHPGIVPVHDAGALPDGRVFYVMKLVEGSRLDQFLAGVNSLPERLRLFLRICDAVSFAHSRGVLHRDLKPSNIMIGAFGEVLVMDWGLAKILASNEQNVSEALIQVAGSLSPVGRDATTAETVATHDGTVMGTPGFMSPEQEQGNASALDQRSDVFSLGRLLEFIAFSSAKPNTLAAPKALRAICDKAASPDRERRYSSVSDLARDISRYLDGAPVSAYRENLWERALRFYNRHQVAILLIAMYLLMRTLFVLYGRR
jgi:serine/threonine protein kinase